MNYSVDKNVIYGMVSGTALLLDVYKPATPNGYGVVYISGSAWRAGLGYDSGGIKDLPQATQYAGALSDAGYTAFAINHRAVPRFRYPAPLEDAQRAVRFVRHHAADFGVRRDRIGACGGSSGGHLSCMLGLLPGAGDPEDSDPVGHESCRVQCVVARAAPIDLLGGQGNLGGGGLADLIGTTLGRGGPGSPEYRLYRDASPITYVRDGAPPFLLLHGEADPVVPIRNSELLLEALTRLNIPTKLVRVPNGGHGGEFPGATNPPDYLGEMVRWFDAYLRV
ncbi:MAG: alpha/beta hydrolase [Chloroflexi bacterium]|nr:alpha/beta hydrolase [Chloroflexota bacterium]